jgi:hypothetical protein
VLDSLSTSDEILAILAQVDELLEQGRTVDEACRSLRVPAETYRLWRKAHACTFLATARQLEALEQVRARMLEVLTEQQLEIQRLRRLLGTRPLSQDLA